VTSVTFDVLITDDSILEGIENFMLTINQSSLPTNVNPGDPSEATVTIVDNDGKEFINIMSVHSIPSLMFSDNA